MVTEEFLWYGVGVPPAATSATVHAAECFTTGASAIAHHAFGDVDRFLFRRLLLPGVLGAALGAYILTAIPGDAFTPYIAGYLLIMGIVIVLKAFREFPPKKVTRHLFPVKPFMILLGLLVIALSVRTILKHQGVI